MDLEKGIPVPKKSGHGYTEMIRRMEIGDSFVAPREHQHKFPHLGKHIKIKVVTRKISDSQVRVWRVE